MLTYYFALQNKKIYKEKSRHKTKKYLNIKYFKLNIKFKKIKKNDEKNIKKTLKEKS